jgi:hypothetical protein
MGNSSSKPAVYPLPVPGQPGYGGSQSTWSMIGSGRKGRGRSNSDGYFMAIPNPVGYGYAPQPYPYCMYQSHSYSTHYLMKLYQTQPKAIRVLIIPRLEVYRPLYRCPNHSQMCRCQLQILHRHNRAKRMIPQLYHHPPWPCLPHHKEGPSFLQHPTRCHGNSSSSSSSSNNSNNSSHQ